VLLHGQNEARKWCFGTYCGLDFNNSPPTFINNVALVGSASSICDLNGNLMFYSNGRNVWNQNNGIMANGSNIVFNNFGNPQEVIAIKKPGSNTLCYVIGSDNNGINQGLKYSIVDMSLAAGLGSVTVKGSVISNTYTSKLAATKHCNGVDYWVVTGYHQTNSFKAHLLSSVGLNTVPVVSTIPNYTTGGISIASAKFSPNGKKFVDAAYNGLTLFDFDASTGQFSNPITVAQYSNSPKGYEFSPDGSKLYMSFYYEQNMVWSCIITQLDLCAGSPTAILASAYTFTNTTAYGSSTWIRWENILCKISIATSIF
jgi:hypothetical protein